MPIGDRIRRMFRDGDDDGRRLVRSGEGFTSGELDRKEITLELPEPTEEGAADEQAEPWCAAEGDPRFAARLAAYHQFLEGREH